LGQSLIVSGKVKKYRGDDPVELNIPFSEQYYKENPVFLKLDSKGNFHFIVKGKFPKIALLRYARKEQWVLLSPGRQTNGFSFHDLP
jgi:hypothetical protein